MSYAVKISGGFDKGGLLYERSFMELFQPPTSSYRFPKTFGIVDDGFDAYLVMEYLEGQTMWEIMQQGANELPASDANDVVNALCELRNDHQRAEKLLHIRSLTPLQHWYPQAFIFAPDGDGGRLIKDIDDFVSFLTIRFKAAEVDMDVISLSDCTDWVLTHGDVTPGNFIRCADGKLGIIDTRTMFLAPSWWEAYALRAFGADPNWFTPLEKAMRRRKLTLPDAVIQELDKFADWFSLLGGTYSR